MENNQADTDAPDSVKVTQKDFVARFSTRWRYIPGKPAASSSHIQQDDTPDINDVSSTVGYVGDTSEKTSQESIASDKSVDAIAATEARK
ncbi:hypothetical protein RND71_038990 [Anisodus tanguticus]|uniref:Uncharacterized protein n=1 Tax=Anisodus tanguticus TaxID=243964 RepID=A0AAE1R1S5_9SOLA|nr:hypothetical protein RND71_038990 [Anisodus tanguticus]